MSRKERSDGLTDDIFSQDITIIKGVGDARAELFRKLGADTVGALLRFFPRDYEDWSIAGSLIDATASGGEPVFVKAKVISGFNEQRVRPGMTIYTGRACDENGSVFRLSFFNNPYIGRILEPDFEYVFHGKVSFDYSVPQMSSPAFRAAGACRELVPVYPQTEGLSSRIISQTVSRALDMLPDPLPDPVPSAIRERYGLCYLLYALQQIHRPDSRETLDIARNRLIFDELLQLQLGLMLLKSRDKGVSGTVMEHDCTEEFFSLLPFEPTGAQRRAVADCVRDMTARDENGRSAKIMSRLLQGDVGSGKTMVAAALCYSCARCGIQSALMAPTEILAEQHYNTLTGLLKDAGLTVELLTGSRTASEKKKIHARLAAGETDIVVGTHALISDGVSFRRLGLVITDEQHRFGVAQRARLAEKGDSPHLLVMSATPIPRTLALIIFGDLDVSVLDEMPRGRQPIETYWIDSAKRDRAYGFIRKHLDSGRQAYIVCPLVEDSVAIDGDIASAESVAAKLATDSFADYSVGLLHGKMKPADKEYVMKRFAAGEIQLLVSTTVIEVGVDVPNAVVMMIENAERFGLSQLHQLRGRVGRGSEQSYCILLSDMRTEQNAYRMRVMTGTTDGFVISQEDLRLRGPGDFFGSRQHGLPDLRIADLSADMHVLEQAQEAARDILEQDPTLSSYEHERLRARTERLFESVAVFN